MAESFHIPRALSDEALRLLTTLPMDEIERRLREPVAVKEVTHSALRPIPVSERLPGPEDCQPWPGEPDETHWCWQQLGGHPYGGSSIQENLACGFISLVIGLGFLAISEHE